MVCKPTCSISSPQRVDEIAICQESLEDLKRAVPAGSYKTIYHGRDGSLYVRQGINLDTLSTVFSDNVPTWSGIASSCMDAAHSTLVEGHRAIRHLEVAGNVLGTLCDFLGVFQTAVDLKDIYHEVKDGQGFFIRDKSRMAFNVMRILFFVGGLLACGSLVTRWIPRCARAHNIISKTMLSTFLVAKLSGATDALVQLKRHSESGEKRDTAAAVKDGLAIGHHFLGALCIVLALMPMKRWMNPRIAVRVSVGFGLGAGLLSTVHYAPQLYDDYKARQKLTKLVLTVPESV